MQMKLTVAMLRIRNRYRQNADGERAASLVEYALLVTLIAIVCLVAVVFFGEETSEEFSSNAESIRNA